MANIHNPNKAVPGYSFSGLSGSQTVPVIDKLKASVSILDAMSQAQRTDLIDSGGTLDVTDAFTRAAAWNVPLALPAGNYNLTTWTAPAVTLLSLCGAGRRKSRIIGPFTGADGWQLSTSADAFCEGVSFEGFNRPIYSSAAIGQLVLRGCGFKQNRLAAVNLLDVTANASSAATLVHITGCRLELTPGFEIKSAVTAAIITDNYFLNLKRDTSVWTAVSDDPSAHPYRLYAVAVGDTDDFPAAYGQDLTKRVVITGNVINGMVNGSANTSYTTNGLSAAAEQVIISHNNLYGISSGDPTNCEMIYTKAQDLTVTDNVIVDGTQQSASIAIKGKSASAPLSKRSIVARNQSRMTGQAGYYGIRFFGNTTDLEHTDNIYDGFSQGGYYVDGNPTRVNHRGNKYINITAAAVGQWGCGDITDCSDVGSHITDQVGTGSGADHYGIKVGAAAGQIKSWAVNTAGSGLTLNAASTFATFLTVSGTGAGATAYCIVVAGALVAVATGSFGSSYTGSPTIDFSPLGGVAPTVTATLSTGVIDGFELGGLRVASQLLSSTMQAYCATSVSVAVASTGIQIDDIRVKAKTGSTIASNGIFAYDLPSTSVGSAYTKLFKGSCHVYGSAGSTGLRTGRANGSGVMMRYSAITTDSILLVDYVDGQPIMPTLQCVSMPGKKVYHVSTQRYASVSANQLGSLSSYYNGAAGYVHITRVRVHVDKVFGAASGTPTVGLGITSNGQELMADVAYTSLTAGAELTTVVDGAAANVVHSNAANVPVYFNIKSAALSATEGFLTVEIDYVTGPS